LLKNIFFEIKTMKLKVFFSNLLSFSPAFFMVSSGRYLIYFPKRQLQFVLLALYLRKQGSWGYGLKTGGFSMEMTWDVWFCVIVFGISVIVGMMALKSL
jgi:hypothetical protein